MPDPRTLLNAAAKQQEPGRRPEFATLRDRAGRRLQHGAMGLTVGAGDGLAIGTILFPADMARAG